MKDPWTIFNYEVYMLLYPNYLSRIYDKPKDITQRAIKNALVESRLLHIRILTEILLSKNKGFKDNLILEELIDKSTQSDFLKRLIAELNSTYGNSKQENSPCWTLNKMLAHASNLRGSSYNYSKIFDNLFPIILSILREIHHLSQNIRLKEHLTFANKHFSKQNI